MLNRPILKRNFVVNWHKRCLQFFNFNQNISRSEQHLPGIYQRICFTCNENIELMSETGITADFSYLEI